MGIRRALVPIVVLVALTGCRVEVREPPLQLSYRDSLVGAGKIVQIENTSNEPLTGLEVRFRAANGEERTYTHPSLQGFESFEVGWKKLGGWELAAGTEVEVSCEGYLRPWVGKIEESAP